MSPSGSDILNVDFWRRNNLTLKKFRRKIGPKSHKKEDIGTIITQPRRMRKPIPAAKKKWVDDLEISQACALPWENRPSAAKKKQLNGTRTRFIV